MRKGAYVRQIDRHARIGRIWVAVAFLATPSVAATPDIKGKLTSQITFSLSVTDNDGHRHSIERADFSPKRCCQVDATGCTCLAPPDTYLLREYSHGRSSGSSVP